MECNTSQQRLNKCKHPDALHEMQHESHDACTKFKVSVVITCHAKFAMCRVTVMTPVRTGSPQMRTPGAQSNLAWPSSPTMTAAMPVAATVMPIVLVCRVNGPKLPQLPRPSPSQCCHPPPRRLRLLPRPRSWKGK